VGKWTDLLLCRPPPPPPAPPPQATPEVLAFELVLRLFNERPETWRTYQGAKLVEWYGHKYAMLEHVEAGVIIQYGWETVPASTRVFHIQVDGEKLKVPYGAEVKMLGAIKNREVNLQRKLDDDRAQKQLKRLVEATENLL
jgi:hypothetical protein